MRPFILSILLFVIFMSCTSAILAEEDTLSQDIQAFSQDVQGVIKEAMRTPMSIKKFQIKPGYALRVVPVEIKASYQSQAIGPIWKSRVVNDQDEVDSALDIICFGLNQSINPSGLTISEQPRILLPNINDDRVYELKYISGVTDVDMITREEAMMSYTSDSEDVQKLKSMLEQKRYEFHNKRGAR